MKMKLLTFVALLLMVSLLNSATKIVIDENQFFSVKTPKTCSLYEQNKFVYSVLKDSYLWSDEVPNLSNQLNNYSSPKALLEVLKNSEDRFSYIDDLENVNQFFVKGKYNNFGFIPFPIQLQNGKTALIVAFVYKNSPAYRAGVRRGSIITQINSKKITEQNLPLIYKKLKKQKSLRFIFWKNHKKVSKKIAKYNYKIKTILYSHIYTMGKKKVGYILISDFITSTKREIDTIFRKFKQKGIDELILDLRYNGGGDVETANYLSSLIGGEPISNRVSEYTLYNQKYSSLNSTLFFKSLPNKRRFNLKRLFVLTTERTCSASERVIHNLKAYDNDIEVIQIGKKTCGKPYGYNGVGIFCNKVLLTINTVAQNSNREQIATTGILPTCEMEESFSKTLGEQHENYLKSALYYIKHERCLY